jgi:uncharacterized repeat protein (TIGR03899 family)
MAKIDKAPVVLENEAQDESLAVTTQEASKQNESLAHQQLFKISQQFGLEASLLPVSQQMPIEDRTHKRARLSSLRKQKNIEAIMEKTYGFCASKDIDKRTDLDWFNSFIMLAEDVSNKTMQDLWAKILAGELSRPGAYSLKALKVFKEMSISDAKLLAKACSLAVKDSTRKNLRLLSGTYQQPGLFNFFSKERQQYIQLSNNGLNYADLLSLADNHLIFIQESELSIEESGTNVNLSYNSLPLKLTSKKANVTLQFYKFTPIGVELAHLIADKKNDDFFSHLQQKLSHHFNISTSE